jgi:hypothetical protein
MSDVTIDAAGSQQQARAFRSLVYTSESVGYCFYVDDSGFFGYKKTTNGGASWGARVEIYNTNLSVLAFDVWYDQWTPGDSGTKIHLAYLNYTDDDPTYRSLDTATDTLGTPTTIAALSGATGGRFVSISITKATGGYLYCAHQDNSSGSERGLRRSTDDGATWSASLSSTFIEAASHNCALFPASGTGDGNDCWAVYHDSGSDALTLKLWDSSAAAAVESATILTLVEDTAEYIGSGQFAASVRHSDGHLIVAAMSHQAVQSSTDLRVFDVAGTGSIAELAAITTNIDNCWYPQVFIDQTNNIIYVAYNGKRDGTETVGTTSKVYYTCSADDGATWAAGDTAYMDGAAADVLQVWTPLMGPRFAVEWRLSGATGGIYTNYVNSVTAFPSGPQAANDAEFIAWLKNPSRLACVLVEAVASVAGVETTRYLSNRGYVTGASDTPAHTVYAGRIVGGARITEQLSLDGAGSMAFGDIELDNTEGDIDDWLDDVWVNRAVRMYVGDMRWPRADFRLVFDGITADMGSRSRDVLNLKVRDKLQRLNTAVTETKLGGASANADRLLPLCFGEVHNIEPLLIDKALLKYQVHNGATERLIEVRDNGVVVSNTPTLAAGTFTLAASPAGVITCSVQGGKLSGTYVNTVAKLVQLLATGYGADPLVAGDLDLPNLAAFNTANPQPVGVPLSERENALAVIQDLAASVGAQAVMSATGALRLIKIALPATGTPTAVTADNMDERSLQIAQRIPVEAAQKLGYCRNWTVQTNIQTGIPAEHKDLYGQEWLTSTAADSAVATAYKLTEEPKQEDTLLLVKADADAEAARRLALWKEQRTVFSYEGMAELLLEELGGYQAITHARFGLSGGVDGQIISIERDWLGARASISVLT